MKARSDTQWIAGAELSAWLARVLPSARKVLIASPFVTEGGMELIRTELQKPRRKIEVTFLTNLDALSLVIGAVDLPTLQELLAVSTDLRLVSLYDVQSLHAKVIIIDDREAVVGSGNLTRSGTQGGNIELGIRITNKKDVQELRERVDHWAEGLSPVCPEELHRLATLIEANFARVRGMIGEVSLGQLQIFTGEEGDYFVALTAALTLAGKKKGCSRRQMLKGSATKSRGVQSPALLQRACSSCNTSAWWSFRGRWPC